MGCSCLPVTHKTFSGSRFRRVDMSRALFLWVCCRPLLHIGEPPKLQERFA